MANVSIKFNGKRVFIICDDGQEEHLEELLIQINQNLMNSKIILEIWVKINFVNYSCESNG